MHHGNPGAGGGLAVLEGPSHLLGKMPRALTVNSVDHCTGPVLSGNRSTDLLRTQKSDISDILRF